MITAQTVYFYKKPRIRFTNHGCILWLGEVSAATGLGVIRTRPNSSIQASRWIYQLWTGESLAHRIELHRMCKTKLCVNPVHMVKVQKPSLTPEQVRYIRKSDTSGTELGRTFSVSAATIRGARRGRTYKWVTDDPIEPESQESTLVVVQSHGQAAL